MYFELNQKTSKVTSEMWRNTNSLGCCWWSCKCIRIVGQLKRMNSVQDLAKKKMMDAMPYTTSLGQLVVKLLVKYLCNEFENDNGQIHHYNEIIASILIPKTKDLNVQAKRGKTTPTMKSVMVGVRTL